MKAVRVVRSFVAADSLAELIAEEYPFQEAVTCKLFSKMLRTQDNDHYQVLADGQKYVARVYQPAEFLERQESDYRYELDWLDFLRRYQAPVSYPIARRDGDRLGRLAAPEGMRYYALFSFAEGTPMAATDEDQLYDVGREMAHIHMASNDYAGTHARQAMDLEFLVDQPVARIRQYWGQQMDAELSSLLAVVEEERQAVTELVGEKTADCWGPIGGDFHPVSTHFDHGRPTFFNFDLCGRGWRAYDIAAFLLNTDLLRKPSGLSEAFFAGYYAVRPLSSNEHEAISPFLTIRRVWLAGVFSVVNRVVGHTFVAPL